MEENRKKLVEFLFENSCCLNCTPVIYCGSFSGKDVCLDCIDTGLSELLQHNVSNRGEQLIAFLDWYKNGKHLFERWNTDEVINCYLKSN
ncbi:MAG: hypothetical protein WC389_16390 [Lutibacter sp.]|jgi:hypothetical protein